MRATLLVPLLALGLVTGACQPSDRRPGLWLSGEAATLPGDWSFTNDYREIAVEVRTPYWLPHSVTVWCAELDGELYLGARDPETKQWPGWADRNPEVRLGVGSKLYEVRLAPVESAELIARIRSAYAAKYELPSAAPGEGPPIRYWKVQARS